jgi:hypothetical protein
MDKTVHLHWEYGRSCKLWLRQKKKKKIWAPHLPDELFGCELVGLPVCPESFNPRLFAPCSCRLNGLFESPVHRAAGQILALL